MTEIDESNSDAGKPVCFPKKDTVKAIDTGGPAFPCQQLYEPIHGWNQTFECGMTLRDWFAGMALQGILASKEMVSFFANAQVKVSEMSYKFADAMLEAIESRWS